MTGCVPQKPLLLNPVSPVVCAGMVNWSEFGKAFDRGMGSAMTAILEGPSAVQAFRAAAVPRGILHMRTWTADKYGAETALTRCDLLECTVLQH